MGYLMAWIAPVSRAHAVSHATAPAEPAYATLYATCAALMIAVLVVFYFDQRVRDRLTARQRGYAIGSLGGVIGTGLLVCLFVLAGIIPDKTTIRVFITIYTLAFLVFTFGAAISAWGREDGARLRQARAPQVAVPSVPIPRGAATERERASELVAAALFIVGQTAPAAVIPGGLFKSRQIE
jgi:predicted permease